MAFAKESAGMDELSVSDSPISTPVAAPTPAQEQVTSGSEFFESDAPVSTVPTSRSVKVRAGKSDHEFNLDPEDKALKEALARSVHAQRYKAEAELKGKKAKQLESQVNELKAHADKAKQIQSLIERGFKDQAVRLMLGDEGYKSYLQQSVTETRDYEDGDDLQKSAIEKARIAREAEFKTQSANDEIRALKAQIEARENAVQKEAYMSQGTAALKAHSFSQYLKNPELADKLDQKLWKLAWSDLEEMSETQGDSAITPAAVAKVFAENAKIMRAGFSKAGKERANAIVEQKKDNAKKVASSMMSSRSPEGFDASQWDGKDPKELLRMLTRR